MGFQVHHILLLFLWPWESSPERKFDSAEQTQFTVIEVAASRLRKEREKNTQFLVLRTFVRLIRHILGVCINSCYPQPGKPLPLGTRGAEEACSIKEKYLLKERKVRYVLFLWYWTLSEYRRNVWKWAMIVNDDLFVLICLIQGDL